MDEFFNIKFPHEQLVYILSIPHQQIKPIILNMFKNFRTRRAANTRVCSTNLYEVDTAATMDLLKKLPSGKANLLRIIQTGSIWSDDGLKQLDGKDTDICEMCGETCI